MVRALAMAAASATWTKPPSRSRSIWLVDLPCLAALMASPSYQNVSAVERFISSAGGGLCGRGFGLLKIRAVFSYSPFTRAIPDLIGLGVVSLIQSIAALVILRSPAARAGRLLRRVVVAAWLASL